MSLRGVFCRAEAALALALVLGPVLGASGCAIPTRQLTMPRYTLTLPETWGVTAQGMADGQATRVLVVNDRSAVAEPVAAPAAEGAEAGPSGGYLPGQSDVELLIYAWSGSVSAGDDTPLGRGESLGDGEAETAVHVARLLARDEALQLRRYLLTPDVPKECGQPPRSYQMFGGPQPPLDLISQPGWRAVIVGGRALGSLVGVVARVPNDPDQKLYCHNLRNMQAQLQRLLDGLKMLPAPAYVPPPPAPPSESLDTRPTLDF